MFTRGDRFGSYEVLEPLGAGGMGEVYRVRDWRLGRDVAVKVLSAQFRLDTERLTRLEREARVLALLNHSNIATLHGVEQLGDTLALVLELVEGETLAERIAHGPIPLAETLAIARQVAAALEVAHERGVVHRDLKPSNIKLRPDGTVKLLDFGLAKLREPEEAGADPHRITVTAIGDARGGVVMGTPAYMSPEQARGLAVDKRTDIWAFGCVLYEMITGEPAFKGEHVSDVVAKIIEREPDFEALPRETPPAVLRLLRSCLRKNPRERLRDIGDAVFDPETAVPHRSIGGAGLLRWAAGGMLLIVMAGAWWWVADNVKGTAHPATAAPRSSVAVLPFVNLTGDSSNEYLGDGMAEELINTLSKAAGLKVPARTSSFAYKGRNVDARQIAKELGVQMIIEGSVRSADDQIRITAQLINAEDGLHLWSETYDEPFTELFKLQARLAKEIATALHANLQSGYERTVAGEPPAQDIEAYRLYLQGRELIQRPTLRNVQQALGLFQQAIARDAKLAAAYTGIADAHLTLLAQLNQPEAPNVQAAEQAVRQALALDPDSAYAHAVFASVNVLRGRYLEAETASQASLRLDSGDGWVHIHRAFLVSNVGMQGGTIREVRRAYELAPGNPGIVAALACTYACRGGFYDEAHKFIQLAMDLGYPQQGLAIRAIRYYETLRSKRYGEAAEILVGMLEQADPEYARTAEVIRVTHAALADPAKKAAALATYARLYPSRVQRATQTAGYDRPRSIRGANCTTGADSYALLGEFNIAYELANYCLDTRASSPIAASIRLWDQELRPFRQDPRFHAYVSRFGDIMAYWEKYGAPDDCDLIDGRLTCH